MVLRWGDCTAVATASLLIGLALLAPAGGGTSPELAQIPPQAAAMAEALNDSLEFAPCGSTTPCNGWTRTLLQSTQIQWEHGAATKSGGASPVAHSGSYAYVTRLAVAYSSGSTANRAEQLRSPVFSLANAQSATLTFWHWYDIEINSGTNYCDGARVDISTNGGTSWSVLTPNGGYPGTVGDGGFACGVTWLEGSQVYGGLSGGWVQATFNLNSYLGSASTHIRFVFAQDPLTGIGGWYIDDVVVSYVPSGTPPTVTVTSPNGGEPWVAQSVHDITWTVTQGTNNLQANSAIISYSSSGCGGTFNVLASGQPNSGPYSWTLPSATTSSGCIRVSVDDIIALRGSDTSDAVFQVVAATPPVVSVVAPNGGESWVIATASNITWGASPGSFPLGTNPITISYSTTGQAGTYNVIATGLANGGSYTWTVPNAPSTNAFVKVEAKDDRAVPNTGSDTSDAAFSITNAAPPAVTVQQPNGGETLPAGGVYQVKWAAAPGTYPLGTDPITIEHSSSGCAGGWTQVATNLANSGSYSWNVPGTPNNSSCIRVQAKDDQPTPNVGSDTSNGVFSIVVGNAAPQVSIVSPTAAGYARGNTSLVYEGADANGDTVAYAIKLSSDSGASWTTLKTESHQEGPSPAKHPVPWDTTQSPDAKTYRIRVEADDGNGSAVNTSHSSDFTVDNAPPSSTMVKLPSYTKDLDILLNWSASDATSGVSSVEIWVREGGGQKRLEWNATNYSGTFYGREGYDYEFWAIAWDRAGNAENKSAPDARTKVDSTAPVSSVKPLPKYSPSFDVQVPFSYVDASTGKVTIWWTESGKGQWAAAGPFAQSPGTVTVPGEGHFEFYSAAVDDAGNAESKQPAAEGDTIIDAKPPDGTITLQESLVSKKSVRVSVSASDAVELARVSVEWANASDPSQTGVGWEHLLAPGLKTFSGDADVALPSGGEFLLTLNATDRAGGSSRFDGGRVTVDIVPPTIATDPGPGAANVSIPAAFALTFSEPVNRSSAEAAVRVLKGTASAGSLTGAAWEGDTKATFTFDGLEGRTAYVLQVSPAAAPVRDIAGNAMKETRVPFTTIPTRGDLTGTVKEAGGGPVKDAVVKLTMGNETKEAKTDKSGVFSLKDLRAGEWSVRVEARGFNALETSTVIVAGQDNRPEFSLARDPLSLLGPAIGGGIAAAVLLALALLLLRKTRKCPQCRNKVEKKANACPHCGTVLHKKSKLDIQREARLSREGAQKQAAEHAALSRKKDKGPKSSAHAAAAAAPPTLAVQQPRPTNCFACGAGLKADEEWCGKCGQAVGAAEHVGACNNCGGTVLDGVCISCGNTVPEVDETSFGATCPRCMSPIPKGSQFCDQCGFDIGAKGSPAGEGTIAPATRRPRAMSAAGALTEPPLNPVAAMHSPKPTMMPPQEPAPPAGPAPVTTPAARAAPPPAQPKGMPGPLSPAPLTPPSAAETTLPASPAMAATRSNACKTCGSISAEGSTWCDVCGERLA
jgi:hypothetical protein